MNVVAEVRTARATIADAAAALASAGVDTPRLDAELLLAYVLGCSRIELMSRLAVPISQADAARFVELVGRCRAREPVAYITGNKGFRNIELRVDSRVLIPRPETELLVDVIAAGAPRTILDVATGSGAVALALADELAGSKITATDVSAAAIEVAVGNARRLGLAERVEFLRSDLLTEVEGRYDALAANLPYVARGDLAGLQPELAFEPREALDGGADGLGLIRVLVSQVRAKRVLAPGGTIALEIGFDQGASVLALLADAGFEDGRIHKDLAGHDRVVAARAPR